MVTGAGLGAVAFLAFAHMTANEHASPLAAAAVAEQSRHGKVGREHASPLPLQSEQPASSGRVLKKNEGRTPKEQMLEVLSYVISFGAFYAFVWVAMRVVRSHGFRAEAGGLSRLMHACVNGDESSKYDKKVEDKADAVAAKETMLQSAARLAVCTVGIQISYLLWGLMQERIMTKPYERYGTRANAPRPASRPGTHAPLHPPRLSAFSV